MKSTTCLIIGAAEHDRVYERQLRLQAHRGKQNDTWARFLTLNYVEYENDVLMSYQLASIAHLAGRGPVRKDAGLFRYADLSTLSAWRTPLLGGIFVYQHLKSHGVDVDLIQHAQLQEERLNAALEKEPAVVAISTTLITSPMEMKTLVKYCRDRSPSSFIVLGGMSIWNQFQTRSADLERQDVRVESRPAARSQRDPLPSSGHVQAPQASDFLSGFGFLGADALVVDPYGVETLLELVTRLRAGSPIDDIPNTVLFESGRVVSPLNRKSETFDAVKMSTNWDLLDDHHIGNIVNIRTQISCPFRCSFCNYPTTQGPVIKAETELIERELAALARRGVRKLMIVDDTFNVPPKRFVDLLEVLRRFDFGWYALVRCQFLHKEHVALMKASGCLGVYLGLEAVDSDILRRMNKHATRDEFLRGIDLLTSKNIITYASFIVGFPGETPETAMKIKEFVENSGLDYYNLKPFWYDHATPVGRCADEFGLTGQGYNWKHATMDAMRAYDLIEDLIVETRGRYVGLHSGELWEIGQLDARGLSRSQINAVYDAHNSMLRRDLRRCGTMGEKRESFSKLVSELRDVSLIASAW